MKVSKIITHSSTIAIFFTVLSGFGAVAASLCNTERFSAHFLLSQNVVVKDVADFKFEILQKQNNISNLSSKLSENNLLVDFSQDAEISDSSEISGLGKPTKTSSISLSHSLNFYQQNIKDNLLKEQLKLEKIQLHQLQLKRQIAKLKMIATFSSE